MCVSPRFMDVDCSSKSEKSEDFLNGTVVKMPHFQHRGHSSIPGQGTKIPHGVQPKKEKEKL